MKTLLLFFLFAPLLLWAKPEIIKPKVKTPTSFAIVVDKQSYDRVKSSIEAYRDAIERDGLATYILVDEWENPDAIREILKKLYADKKNAIGRGCIGRRCASSHDPGCSIPDVCF